MITIDFSGADHHSSGLVWQFDIPDGTHWGIDEAWRKDVLRLQRQHGCLNVTSGIPHSLGPDTIGVYMRPNVAGQQHRTNMCSCFDSKTTDLVCWPPRY